MNRATSLLLAAALLLTGCDRAAGSEPAAAGRPDRPVVKIMPLGDSITDGRNVPGGYRAPLWKNLTAMGARVDFVGSTKGGPRSLPDRDHEGHSGWRIDEIDAHVVTWVNAANPAVVLLHIGTNDAVQDYHFAEAPARLGKLIDHIRAAAPDADIYVAAITPLDQRTYEERVQAFNARIPDLVASRGPKVHFVDMHAALKLSDLDDGVHPNASGYSKMAAAWADALRPRLAG
ncbi:SGNH/GDSL hydrolase family protein [Dactylosporangium sp. CA-092794]|uniref:SGNH/GDSL hydrolase family protein n=1 Tax=Dactylosporangium sp. CA-092794 TaxID=3239929 RepID=UPI003D8DC62C